MADNTPDYDKLHIIDDGGIENACTDEPWQILVVDDDEEVHAATRLALARTTILGRPLALTHALSAHETMGILQKQRDFAAVLLDVVMETETAGLQLVSEIRNTFGMLECRIILRTGQPGSAPEIAVFNDYDINDYCTKSELTRTRLITALMAALRSYQQIRTIAENRRGLELIVRAVPGLMESHAINTFAEGALTQIAALLKIPPDGIVCAQKGSPLDNGEKNGLFVVAAAGRLAACAATPLEKIGSPKIIEAITHALAAHDHVFDEHFTVLFLKGGDQEAAVYLETSVPVSQDDRQLVEVLAANITACFANVKYVEKLNFIAYHDTLTQLGNRSLFTLQLETAMQMASSNCSLPMTVALIDIDHFSDINNGLGQEVGNGLLMSVANRLHTQFGKECQMARIGADVFGILGPEKQVNPTRLQTLFEQHFSVGEHQLPASITMGFAIPKSGPGGGNTLLKQASIALNRAKRAHNANYAFFEGEMEDDTRWRLEIIRHLRRDFSAQKLAVWYQPQINLATGQVVGMEALLRWPGEIGFVQPPSVFIPLAEYSGLIVDIGDWVLQTAADAYRTLAHLPNRPHHVSVNVSMPQFKSGNLTERVATILGEHMLPPSVLELEITESIALDQPRHVISCLRDLRDLGVRIAIDDFGTGYSSLGQLKALPIDCLKIDQSFVAEISAGRGGMFAETIVALGQKLGLETIAEGVETAEQAGFLRGLGCSDAQGYYYAKPMPLPELITWLENWQHR